MNDDKLKSLFAIYEAREPGRAYVEPFHGSNGKQRGWKASTKWGRVKYFGSDFKSAAERHAGIDTSDNVNDQGMDEGKVWDGVKAFGRGVGRVASGAYAGFDMYDKVQNQGKSVPRAAAETGAALAGGYAGAKALGAIGAGIGTLGGPLAPVTVPVGGLVGGLVGGVGGYYAVDRIASAAADRIAAKQRTARAVREAIEKMTTDPKKPSSRFFASNSLSNIYKKDTPGQCASLEEDSVPVIRRSYMRTNPRTGERKVIKGRAYKRTRDFTDDDDNKQDMPKGPVSV